MSAHRPPTHSGRLAGLLLIAALTAGCSFSVGTGTQEEVAATPAAAAPAATPDPTVTPGERTIPELEPPEPTPVAAATAAPAAAPTATPTPTPATPTPASGGGDTTVFTEEVPMTSAPAAGQGPYAGYVTITDDLGRISVEVPSEWSDVDGAPVQSGDTTIADVRASSDLTAFASTWTTPGVIVSAADVPGATAQQVLDEEQDVFAGQCTFESRQPYSDPLYVGEFDIYRDCGGTGVTYVIVAAQLPDGTGPIIEVQVQVTGERDLEALDRIVNSFVVI